MPIAGRRLRTARAISDSVPSPPPKATTPSAVRARIALRPSPSPVAIARSTYWFAAAGSSPGSNPMVSPPAARAPRAACSITPVSPPQMSTASRSAMPRPSSKASSASDVRGSDSPQTATRRRRELNDESLALDRPQRNHAGLLEVPDAHLRRQMRRDVTINSGQRRVRLVDHQRHARATPLTNAPIEWDLAQERDIHPLGQGLRPAMAEDIFAFAAVRADEITHVLDQPQVRDFQRVEHLDGAPDVGRRDVLRRGDDHGARHRDALRHRQLHVARPRRQVDDQVIQLAPVDVEQKLPDGSREHGSAPDGRLIGLDEEGN